MLKNAKNFLQTTLFTDFRLLMKQIFTFLILAIIFNACQMYPDKPVSLIDKDSTKIQLEDKDFEELLTDNFSEEEIAVEIKEPEQELLFTDHQESTVEIMSFMKDDRGMGRIVLNLNSTVDQNVNIKIMNLNGDVVKSKNNYHLSTGVNRVGLYAQFPAFEQIKVVVEDQSGFPLAFQIVIKR